MDGCLSHCIESGSHEVIGKRRAGLERRVDYTPSDCQRHRNSLQDVTIAGFARNRHFAVDCVQKHGYKLPDFDGITGLAMEWELDIEGITCRGPGPVRQLLQGRISFKNMPCPSAPEP